MYAMILKNPSPYFCAVVKEIFSKSFLSLDFFGSFFHQGKNEQEQHCE
jgi:hypothetical protein